MLADLNDEIADAFGVCGCEAGMRIGKAIRDLLASEAEVRTVVGKANAGSIWQYNQVVGDYSCLSQFNDRIDLTAANDLMGQQHVLVLGLTVSPAGETRTDEEFAIEGVGNTIIQLSLPHGGVRSKVYRCMLSDSFQAHDFIGPFHQQ